MARRQGGFDITAASEVMAALCLAEGLDDLKARLGRIIVGFDYDKSCSGESTECSWGDGDDAEDAIKPNLVQTLEGTPAIVHGGPFANIAHGTNTVIADKMALRLADYVVTEAGFGFDLGGEKFFHIPCRMAGLSPLHCHGCDCESPENAWRIDKNHSIFRRCRRTTRLTQPGETS